MARARSMVDTPAAAAVLSATCPVQGRPTAAVLALVAASRIDGEEFGRVCRVLALRFDGVEAAAAGGLTEFNDDDDGLVGGEGVDAVFLRFEADAGRDKPFGRIVVEGGIAQAVEAVAELFDGFELGSVAA